MPLNEIIQPDVAFVTEDTTIRDVAKMMYEKHVGSIIVVEKSKEKNGVPVGIFTDRDIAMAYGKDGRLDGDITVKKLMSKNIINCSLHDGIYESIQKMKVNGVRRMPVVDDKGEIEGIVTMDDMLMLLASEFKNLSDIIKSEAENEKKSYDFYQSRT